MSTPLEELERLKEQAGDLSDIRRGSPRFKEREGYWREFQFVEALVRHADYLLSAAREAETLRERMTQMRELVKTAVETRCGAEAAAHLDSVIAGLYFERNCQRRRSLRTCCARTVTRISRGRLKPATMSLTTTLSTTTTSPTTSTAWPKRLESISTFGDRKRLT
jgi:hypothetical protein